MATVGRYEILRQLGVGGMAEVLLGRTTGEGGFEKLVAIKRILTSMAENESFVKMFIDEARISAKLNHSSIGQIFEFGKSGETYFICMEYIQGVDLRAIHRHFQKQGGTPPAEMAIFIITNICSALHYAHTRGDSRGKPLGLIHRDLSPSNVLISFTGECKLIDFGIAKAAERLYVTTVGGNLKGKYAYMSPEQASGEVLDHRSDVFGAGTLLFELLTGRNPYRAKSDMETLQRVQAARVPPPSAVVPSVPPELDAICLKALARRPDSRFDSAGDMQKALEQLARRTAFSSRRMSRFMGTAFAELQEKEREMLRQARAEADAGNVEVVTSRPDDLNDLFGPGSDPRGEAAALKHLATASLEVHKSANGQISLHEPGGQAQLTPSGVHAADSQPSAQVVINPSSAGPPRQDPSASFVTVPGQPAPQEGSARHELDVDFQKPLTRRSNSKIHVLVFTLLVLAVGAIIFYLAGDHIRAARDPKSVYGTLSIVVPNPAPAQVLVDDQPHGALDETGQYLVEDLLPGKHRLTIKGPGLKKLENVVEITSGKVVELQVFLSKAAPADKPKPDAD